MIDIYRNNKDTWNNITQEVIDLVKKYNANLLVETNGVGDPIYSNIKDEWQNTHPFTTTNKSKQEIIEGLILDVNEQNIRIPSKDVFETLQTEMEVFTYNYNPKTRSISYGHPKGLHDDTVMSLAICNYGRKKNKNYGSYTVMGRRY